MRIFLTTLSFIGLIFAQDISSFVSTKNIRIAESINKNHATIVYLLKNATSYFKQDEDLNFRYENCKSLFESHHSPIMDMTRREILRLYVKLDSQYDMLIKHNEELQEENTQLKKTIEELDLSKNY